MKRLHVHYRIMTSHDACTSGTSRVLTVASLQRFEDGDSYSSSCRLWSAVCDKVSECTEHSADRNSLSTVPAVISHRFPAPCSTTVTEHLLFRKLCARWMQKQLTPKHKAKHIGVNIDNCGPSFLKSQEIPVWSASAYSEWQRGRDECHTVIPIPGGRLRRWPRHWADHSQEEALHVLLWSRKYVCDPKLIPLPTGHGSVRPGRHGSLKMHL